MAEEEGKRIRISEMLLLNTITEALTLENIEEKLKQVIEEYRKSYPEFYYDLGFYETTETALRKFENRGWIVRTNIACALTFYGLSHLDKFRLE